MADVQITVLDQLDQLEEIVLDGSRIPFSGGRLVNENDAIEVIDGLREAVPIQLGQARDLLAQREDFITKARQQAEEIVAVARRAARLHGVRFGHSSVSVLRPVFQQKREHA